MEKMIYALSSAKGNAKRLQGLLAGMKGVAGTDLYTLSSEEITAIVCDVDRSGLIADRSTAVEFAAVIDLLSQQFTLLPVRFASIMESAEAVINMVERNTHDILQNLHKVDNKFEYGLKIFCEPEMLLSELKAKSQATVKIEQTHAREVNHSVYREWVNKKLEEHRSEELIIKYVDSVVTEITIHLGRLNATSKLKKMTSASTIIEALFLLDKASKEALVASVEELQKTHTSLTFVLTGPWPPYNFVDFTVK